MTGKRERASQHEQPIKINWTGDTRTKFITRQLEPSLSDDDDEKANDAKLAMETVTRLETRIVVETFDEASALKHMLLLFEKFCSEYGAMWASENRRKAVARVHQELFDKGEQRGWF